MGGIPAAAAADRISPTSVNRLRAWLDGVVEPGAVSAPSSTTRAGGSLLGSVPGIRSIEAIAVAIPVARDLGGSTYSVLWRCTVVTPERAER
jgi:hypothetical protein